MRIRIGNIPRLSSTAGFGKGSEEDRHVEQASG